MAELKLHDRVLKLVPSATLAMVAKAKVLRDQGHHVISLSAGEPDSKTPKAIIDEVIRALKSEDVGHYTPVRGTDALIEAVRIKFERDQGLSYAPEQVVTTVGAKPAIAMALEAICGPGDEVIVLAPFWVSYPEQIRLVGAKPVIVEGRVSQGYLPTLDALRAAISPKTKAMILNSPNNPSGAVYPESFLREAMALVKDTGVWVISDEIYEHLLFDGVCHISPASFSKDAYSRTIVISGASKGYAMTGWRVGFAAGPKEVIGAMVKLQSQRDTCLPAVTQVAAAFALLETPDVKAEIERMRASYEKRRDRVMELLAKIPGLSCHKPQGAFYALIDVAEHIGQVYHGKVVEDDTVLAMRLLEEAHVATVAGTPFGVPGTLRISLASSMADLEEGLRRIAQWLA